VDSVREYCREYLNLTEVRVTKKIDIIFYNEDRAIIVDWKFSAFSAVE
jgi:hypothetical protein